MFKFFFKFEENVSEACYKSKRAFNRGFRQGAMRAYAQGMLHKLKKATPRSDRTTKHAADDWEIEYTGTGPYISGFEIVNPHDRIDWVEYGTERPRGGGRIYAKNAQALHFFIGGDEIFASSVEGSKIEPMGFVRKVQDEMEQNMPSFVRDSFEKEINRFWD